MTTQCKAVSRAKVTYSWHCHWLEALTCSPPPRSPATNHPTSSSWWHSDNLLLSPWSKEAAGGQGCTPRTGLLCWELKGQWLLHWWHPQSLPPLLQPFHLPCWSKADSQLSSKQTWAFFCTNTLAVDTHILARGGMLPFTHCSYATPPSPLALSPAAAQGFKTLSSRSDKHKSETDCSIKD